MHGLVVVENFDGFTFSGALRMQKAIPQRTMNKMMAFMSTAAPFRLKGIYLLNQPWRVAALPPNRRRHGHCRG